MRKIPYLLITLAALLLLTGCTTFQAAEARRWATVGLLEAVLDGAVDELLPYERSALAQQRHDAAEREREERRKREREKRHYDEEAAWMLDSIDEAEQRPDLVQSKSATTDYEQQEEERRVQREKALENQPEFDEFMRELDAAEEKNDDPRLARISGE
jgi:hypothetical protein